MNLIGNSQFFLDFSFTSYLDQMEIERTEFFSIYTNTLTMLILYIAMGAFVMGGGLIFASDLIAQKSRK